MKNLKEQNNLKEIKKGFNYRDPFLLEEQLYEDEILIRNTAEINDPFSMSKSNLDKRKIKMKQMNRDEALEAFKIWQNKEDKIKY